MRFHIHFNRIAMQRGDAAVWSVQTSKGCYHGKEVIVNAPIRTTYKPEKRQNPRAFFSGDGDITVRKGVIYIDGN